jgi:uncharacterized membrane protein
VKCHGKDGTGSRARSRYTEIPDFSNASWQAGRSDQELTDSILDGKGSAMPPAEDGVGEEQARGLAVYVRAFTPAVGQEARVEHAEAGDVQGQDLPESSLASPSPGFAEKLIRWLGKFHPPAVHFPIALLSAAAVAEVLRMATGKPEFDEITRFCIWLGALTALGAGLLGWFLGGFHLADASWVMMAHRWLGTLAVLWAGLVLLLCEMSRQPGRLKARICFRCTLFLMALLVSVTGFLGGTVVFGFNHYQWPK